MAKIFKRTDIWTEISTGINIFITVTIKRMGFSWRISDSFSPLCNIAWIFNTESIGSVFMPYFSWTIGTDK